MRICMDFRPALREGTGVGTYVRNLLAALAATGPDDEITALTASWRHRPAPDTVPRGVRVVDWRIPVRLLDRCWHRWEWPPVELLAGRQEIAHSPSPMLLPARSARRVVTVHDCWFLRHPEDVYGPVLRDYVPLARRAARLADAVLVPSATTGGEVEELLGVPTDRIHVTPLGVDPSFVPAAGPARGRREPERHEPGRGRVGPRGAQGPPGGPVWTNAPELGPTPGDTAGLPSPGYLLFVGRREPRKDPDTLLAAFDRLLDEEPDARLVIAGPDAPGWDAAWQRASGRARRQTRLLPHQPPGVVSALYAGAAALVMPSRWEGFGLPALEALAAGVPVVATRAGALPEVLGDAALWADPGDADEIAAQCRRVLTEPDVAADLRRRGRERAATFRWEVTAERTRAAYRQVAGP